MAHYKYIIVGGGMTADSAVKGIREIDGIGPIALFSAEPDPPYDRPPLSKGLWKGKPVEKVWRGTQDRGVEMHLNTKIVSLDPRSRKIKDSVGGEHSYENLLLATGGKPRRLPFGDDSILYYRSFRDYERLRAASENKQRFAVIGGGFIGSEIAAALTMNGKEVVMVFPEAGIGGLVYPENIALYLVDYYREKGVEVQPHEMVAGLETDGDQSVLKTQSGREFRADMVIAGIGITPNTGLAMEAGLETDNGIIVDEHCRTSDPDIYAAGDVAEFYNPALNKRMRVEHEDNANAMGKLAGRSMAGADDSYDYLPMFYSDLFDHGYEAVGELNAELETFVDWQEPYQKGVIYYLKDGQVRGVLLWNVWDQVDNARQLIGQTIPTDELQSKLPA
jgi:3-phenylpropionate/trans-cinnamate dioxygenase ferredoxin reductase component